MADLFHSIAELGFQMEKAQSLTPVREILHLAAATFDSDFFLFGMRSGKGISPPIQIVITNYPKRWQRRYDELGALAFDPVFGTAMQFKGPFRWEGIHHTEQQLELRRESVRNGMEFGFSCGDRGPDSSIAILSFCGNRRIAPEAAQWERAAASLSLLVTSTHKTVNRILQERDDRARAVGQSLSINERKCLQMMAAAMTAEQAAAVLGVRPRTVRYYLDRAAEKLGVTTRKEAVTKALAEGIIDTRQFPDLGFGRETEMHG